jgi:hypothetical protein
MNKHVRPILLFLMGLLTVSLAACQVNIIPATATSCTSDFEATVHHGPNQGLSLQGQLRFRLDTTGALRGQLTTTDGQQINATGQATGQAINLILTVGTEQYVFGTGTASDPVYTCQGVWGGGFTGPQPGDSGDWLTRTIGDPNQVPADFKCGQELGNLCQCVGTADCVDLAEAGLCKDRITFEDPATKKPTGDTGFCSYK